MPSRRRIVVTSNCQTFGIAAALAAIYHEDVVAPYVWPTSFAEVSDCDILVFDALNSNASKVLSDLSKLPTAPKVVTFPRIRFDGFHPDLCYVRRRSTQELTSPHYNSGIAVWAFNNGLSAASAELLFCHESFLSLRYYDSYTNGAAKLRDEFSGTDISFNDFFLPVKRAGLFMYTYNHPKIAVLVHMAHLIANKIGLEGACIGNDLGVADGLTSEIWPVYPEIAAMHSLSESSYNWKLGSSFFCGLRKYLDWAFETYESQGIPRGDLEPVVGLAKDVLAYDRVLGGKADSWKRFA